MSCACGSCECEALREQNMALMAELAETEAHLGVLIALDEKRRDAEKQFDRQLIEARGKVREPNS